MTSLRRSAHPRPPGYALADEAFAPDGSVVIASGELDIGAASALRERLQAVLESGATRLIVDLSEVAFIDSLSLAAVVGAHRRLGDPSRLAIVATHPYVRLILDAAGVGSIVAVYDTRDEALAHVAGQPG
jgi:anti-sigma B factor antagonist